MKCNHSDLSEYLKRCSKRQERKWKGKTRDDDVGRVGWRDARAARRVDRSVLAPFGLPWPLSNFLALLNPKKGANECGYSGNAPKLPSIFRKLPPAVRDLYFLNSCVLLCWFNILLLNAALLSCSKSQPHTISSIHKGNYLFIIHLFIHYLSPLSFHLRPKTVRRVEVES